MITRIALLTLHCDHVDETRQVRRHCDAKETFGGGPSPEQAVTSATTAGWTLRGDHAFCRRHKPDAGSEAT